MLLDGINLELKRLITKFQTPLITTKTIFARNYTYATIMLTKHSYIFTSIIIIALCLVKNPRNVLKKLHAVLGMMLKAIITTSLERNYSEMVGL